MNKLMKIAAVSGLVVCGVLLGSVILSLACRWLLGSYPTPCRLAAAR